MGRNRAVFVNVNVNVVHEAAASLSLALASSDGEQSRGLIDAMQAWSRDDDDDDDACFCVWPMSTSPFDAAALCCHRCVFVN